MTALLLVAALAHGAPAAPPLRIGDYVAQVLAVSPEVAQAQARADAARHSWRSAAAAAVLPTVSFTALDYPYGHNPSDSYRWTKWRFNRDDIAATTTLNLNLFNSFQDYLRARAASLGRRVSEQELETALQTKAFEAGRAFYQLSLKARLLDVARQNLTAQQEQYRLTQELYQSGMKSLADVLKSETDLRSSELRESSADAEHRRSLLDFNARRDQDPDAPAAPEPGEDSAGLPADPAADAAKAQTARSEAVRAAAALDRAAVAFRQSVRSALPTFSVDAAWNARDVAGYGRPITPTGVPNPDYQVVLKLALPSGYNVFSQASDAAASRAEERRARSELAGVRRQIRVEVHQAWIDLSQSLAAERIAARKEEIARRSLDLVNEQYRQGSADVIRLGQAQLDYLQARVERTQAQHDTLVNRAQYRLATGEPLWR